MFYYLDGKLTIVDGEQRVNFSITALEKQPGLRERVSAETQAIRRFSVNDLDYGLTEDELRELDRG
jgi:hypothetical protein